MKVYTVLHGGIGDMMLQMMTPGKPFGYLADCKARGAETAVVMVSDRPCARELLTGATFIDHIFTATKGPVKPPPGFTSIADVHKRTPLEWQATPLVLTAEEQRTVDMIPPGYVALHLGGSTHHKRPPVPNLLMRKLRDAGIRYVVIGHDSEGAPPPLRTHIGVARKASKFIGSLSMFNVVAQLDKKPSFVLVNRALKEPLIYGLMAANGARIEPWNGPGCKPIEQIYAEAAAWAAS